MLPARTRALARVHVQGACEKGGADQDRPGHRLPGRRRSRPFGILAPWQPAGHCHDPGEARVNAGATAQDAYRLMLREYIAPALRALGVRGGPPLGAFRHGTAANAAEVRFRKSRGSTRNEVSFWTGMHASDIKPEWVYWARDLHSLASGLGELLCPWRVSSSGPVEPVASEVLRVFGSYGWPAIQAALDNPGYPEDPTVRWPRAFPKIPRGPLFDGEVAATRRPPAGLGGLMAR